MQGHYVQTWCHKYSTCPLRTIKPWLQEVVPSVHCLQRVFLCAKPKAACEPHCLSLAATSSSLSLCATMTLSIKTEIRKILLRRHKRTKPRPWVTCIKNLAKIGRVVPKIWPWTDKHTHTDTIITILCFPIASGVNRSRQQGGRECLLPVQCLDAHTDVSTYRWTKNIL